MILGQNRILDVVDSRAWRGTGLARGDFSSKSGLGLYRKTGKGMLCYGVWVWNLEVLTSRDFLLTFTAYMPGLYKDGFPRLSL